MTRPRKETPRERKIRLAKEEVNAWVNIKPRFLAIDEGYDDYEFLVHHPKRFVELMNNLPIKKILIYDEEFAEWGLFSISPEAIEIALDKVKTKEDAIFFLENIYNFDCLVFDNNVDMTARIFGMFGKYPTKDITDLFIEDKKAVQMPKKVNVKRSHRNRQRRHGKRPHNRTGKNNNTRKKPDRVLA